MRRELLVVVVSNFVFCPVAFLAQTLPSQTSAAAAQSAAFDASNPFAKPSTLLYQAPPFDKIKDSDFQPALEEGMRQQLAEVEAIANNPDAPTFVNTIEAMERTGELLQRVQPVISGLAGSNKNPAIQQVQTEEAPKLAAHQHRNGHPLVSPRCWFDDAVIDAGLSNFTWHCIRHTFASRLVMNGVDLRTVQELMGHKTISMTCRYAHLAASHKLAAVERLVVQTGAAQGAPSDTRSDTRAIQSQSAERVAVN